MPHPLQVDDGRRWLGWHVGIRWMIRWMTLVAPRGVSGACLSQRVCVSVCVQVSLIKSQRIQRAVSPVPVVQLSRTRSPLLAHYLKYYPLYPCLPRPQRATPPRAAPRPRAAYAGTGIPRGPRAPLHAPLPTPAHTDTRPRGSRLAVAPCGACGGGALPLASGHCALAWGAFCESFFLAYNFRVCAARERESAPQRPRCTHVCPRPAPRAPAAARTARTRLTPLSSSEDFRVGRV